MALPDLRGQRLTLVPASPDHLEFYVELNLDDHVMHHIAGGPASRLETEAEWSRRLGPRSDADRGLGYWTGLLAGRPIGWWGLGHDERSPEAGELGFRVERKRWRQGLGREGARLVVDHGFTTAGVTRIWAGTVTANAASRATLAGLGFECTDEPAPGVLTYEITLDRWLHRGSSPA